MNRIWTYKEIRIALEGRAAGKLSTEIAAEILAQTGKVRTTVAIKSKAALMRAPRVPANYRQKQYEPDLKLWIEIATQEARNANLRPCDVIGGLRKRSHVHARWRAWRAILGAYPGASVAGVGRVSGFDHSSVLDGLRRLSAVETRKPEGA